MKIRNQVTLLITIIITIPLLFIFFIFSEKYLQSTDRYLIEGSKEIEKIDRENNEDYDDAFDILEGIPPRVEKCLIALNTSTIIFNTIPELENVYSLKAMWDILSINSSKYFYQFTSPATKKPTLIVTRIPRTKQSLSSTEKLIYSLIFVFFITLLVCVLSMIAISKTVLKSIIKIKDATKSIANGNLSTPINTNFKKENYNEIMSILESLEIMRQSLCEAESRKSNFIMGISHDLRTPVAIIKGYTEALNDKVITEKKDVEEALRLIHVKTEHLESMINELINFTKLNSFELREKLEPNSITKLIKVFAKESELSANVYDRTIVSDIDIPDDILVPMNNQLIMRTFENIFSNALRYTRDCDNIEIKSFIQDNEIVLKISDTGIGINEKDLPHIFDLFYKSSNSRQGQSMGIGLAVVKSVLDTHGWAIDVASEHNQGTCFSIFIPFK